jgi:hypothetical protein
MVKINPFKKPTGLCVLIKNEGTYPLDYQVRQSKVGFFARRYMTKEAVDKAEGSIKIMLPKINTNIVIEKNDPLWHETIQRVGRYAPIKLYQYENNVIPINLIKEVGAHSKLVLDADRMIQVEHRQKDLKILTANKWNKILDLILAVLLPLLAVAALIVVVVLLNKDSAEQIAALVKNAAVNVSNNTGIIGKAGQILSG